MRSPASELPLTPTTAALLICEQVAQKLAAESIALRWHLVRMPLVKISSSVIRQFCRDRRSIRDLVPESVQDYILEQNLYLTE
ncbi:MAG: hypothetical protein HC769_31385 [Cyanobacteria bacterium CRU_2_1]|nr:hypothetical protein [Cyanobacteria bacterium RU_5_0]NJR62897.1 hypothetical protein [Cyanobacteria bacterium CRU_2_1]